MDFDLRGRVALVTGGNGGIGRGIALGLGSAGASIAIAARNEAKTDAVLEELKVCGIKAIGVRCDVTQREEIDAAVQIAREAFGGLHVLVNNAGVSGGGDPEEISEAVWDEVLDTNLKATFHFSQAAYPLLVEAGGGKIINIGSEYSSFGSAHVLPYSASKGGVIQLTRSLAIAWAQKNIQVNALIPGWIRTEMTARVDKVPQLRDAILRRTPAGRFGDPKELAGPAVFLASHASDFVTGISLPVDGGYAIA